MRPKPLMVLGIFAGVVGVAGSMLINFDATVFMFAAGALFGKGYGIWEVRHEL